MNKVRVVPVVALTALACSTAFSVAGAMETSAELAPVQPAAQQLPAADRVDLRVDANRDGQIDLVGATDAQDQTATPKVGALFLPNIDDDGKRCAATDETCSDATDNVVNGERDAADLARIQMLAMPKVSDSARGVVRINAGNGNTVRLFVKDGNTWRAVPTGATISAQALRAGLTFGLEGTDILRSTRDWDGVAKISIEVTDGGASTSDTVALRLAPVMSHHHGQKNQQVLTSPYGSGVYAKFERDLGAAVKKAGVPNPLFVFERRNTDQWTQDWVEPFYTSMPGPNGTQTMRVLMRSDQNRPAQKLLYGMRGTDVGVVKPGKGVGRSTRSSYGNLETIPPHGNYPAGRIILGKGGRDAMSGSVQEIIGAQGMQNPIILDTSWLQVGHVDEFMQFLPANNALGFKVAVADPNGTIAKLREQERQGNGNVRAGGIGELGQYSISGVLRDSSLMDANAIAARVIESNLNIIKRETGITEADVVRVPAIYKHNNNGWWAKALEQHAKGEAIDVPQNRYSAAFGEDGVLEAAQEMAALTEERVQRGRADVQDTQMIGAFYPMAVNGVVAAPDAVIAPKQWGPIIKGNDIMSRWLQDAYSKAAMKVIEVDDYESYHVLQGEVHCGSNSLRTIPTKWW